MVGNEISELTQFIVIQTRPEYGNGSSNSRMQKKVNTGQEDKWLRFYLGAKTTQHRC
jgi:hypothetical protein